MLAILLLVGILWTIIGLCIFGSFVDHFSKMRNPQICVIMFLSGPFIWVICTVVAFYNWLMAPADGTKKN